MNYVNNRGISSEKYKLFPLSKIDISYAKTIQMING
jgi:hypothetical protein